MSNLLLDVTFQLQRSSPSSKYSSSDNKNENTRNFRKRKNIKKNPKLSLSICPLCYSVGVFIGDIRRRVPVQLSYETSYPDLSKLLRKHGYGRVSAAIGHALSCVASSGPFIWAPPSRFCIQTFYLENSG